MATKTEMARAIIQSKFGGSISEATRNNYNMFLLVEISDTELVNQYNRAILKELYHSA